MRSYFRLAAATPAASPPAVRIGFFYALMPTLFRG